MQGEGYALFFYMEKNTLYFNLIGDFVKEIPVLNIPQEVIDFIELMKTAKYSTFLNQEKEDIYHSLNIQDAVNSSVLYTKSLNASIILNNIVNKYIRDIKTQSFEDDYM